MIEQFELDNFEPILIKGIVSDPSVLSNLTTFLSEPKSLFKDNDFVLLASFYKFFFDKREKLPSKDELNLFISKPERLEACKRAFSKINYIDFDSLDKDLFYKSAERFIKERGIWNTMISVASQMEKGLVTPSDILAQFEKICTISLDNEKGLDLYEDIDQVIKSLKEDKKTISTGYKSIDDNIDGGFYADGRALYMFMAPPNKGKSLFLGNIACNIADQGKTALVISLEMSEIAYATRFCSQQTSIPFAQLHLRTDEIVPALKNKAGKIIIKEFPPSTITVPQLKAWIKRHIIECGINIDVIIIDYLNLFDGPGSGLYEKIKTITEQVRALSYYFHVPVCSATQANRTADGKSMAGLNAVSESIGIAATADVLLEIFQNEEDSLTNYFRVGFSKNRYGPVNFSVVTKIDYETLKIVDLNEEADYKTTLGSSIEDSLNLLLEGK